MESKIWVADPVMLDNSVVLLVKLFRLLVGEGNNTDVEWRVVVSICIYSGAIESCDVDIVDIDSIDVDIGTRVWMESDSWLGLMVGKDDGDTCSKDVDIGDVEDIWEMDSEDVGWTDIISVDIEEGDEDSGDEDVDIVEFWDKDVGCWDSEDVDTKDIATGDVVSEDIDSRYIDAGDKDTGDEYAGDKDGWDEDAGDKDAGDEDAWDKTWSLVSKWWQVKCLLI